MKEKKVFSGLKSKLRMLVCILFLQMNRMNVFAEKAEGKTESAGGDIGQAKLFTGTIKLLKDLSNVMLVISPIAGGVLASYFFIRKNAADETDQKQWDKRIKITLVCVIGAVAISGVISAVTGYYK